MLECIGIIIIMAIVNCLIGLYPDSWEKELTEDLQTIHTKINYK